MGREVTGGQVRQPDRVGAPPARQDVCGQQVCVSIREKLNCSEGQTDSSYT